MWAIPRYRECHDCGVAVLASCYDSHRCDPKRKLDYEVHQLREGIESLDDDFAAYLASPKGSFNEWYAEHRR